jgi:hypothetical protein
MPVLPECPPRLGPHPASMSVKTAPGTSKAKEGGVEETSDGFNNSLGDRHGWFTHDRSPPLPPTVTAPAIEPARYFETRYFET